jgi:hypothetical protein
MRVNRGISLGVPLAFGLVLCLAAFPIFPFQAAGASIPAGAEFVPRHTAPYNPAGLLRLLLLSTFYLHLLLVNILVGSTFLALVNSFRRPARADFQLRDETAFIPTALALAVNLGVAPYLFMQVLYGNFFFSSTLLMAVWWLALSGVVMFAYYGLYIVSDKSAPGPAASRWLLAGIFALLALAAFTLTNNTSLMLRPDTWPLWFDSPGGSLLNTSDSTLFPRFLHMILAMIATGGLVFALRANWAGKRNRLAPDAASERIRYGLFTFRVSVALCSVAGLWYLLAMPQETRGLFLGADGAATGLLALSVVGIAAALILAGKQRLTGLTVASACTIGLMVIMRDMARANMLQPYADASERLKGVSTLLLGEGQEGAFLLFAGCTIFAVAAIALMLRPCLRALRESGSFVSDTAGAGEER